MNLERYRGVVDDWEDFWEASHSVEPVTFRARDGLIDPQKLADRLTASGFHLRAVEGVDGYLRVEDGPGSVAQTLEHWLGLLHVQQVVMGLPSLALAPEPGERVLDLCAAPGGKTAHLSELMKERGPLIAVDPKEKRIRGLLGNLYRLGHSNVIVIAGDGRQLPEGARFDRVLVDAPCSGEGNYRRRAGRLPGRTSGFSSYVTALQESLLRRAIELTRPGGVIVYSTCTYAPEENEAVLDRVLGDAPVTLEPIPLEAPHAPGLTDWKGRRFSAALAYAWRVYPHHLDSGGLFMARLRHDDRVRPDDGGGWTPIPEAFFGESKSRARERVTTAIHELEDWFGLSPALLGRLGWMVRGKHIWSHTAERWPVAEWRNRPGTGSWRVVSVGLRALRSGPGNFETPTSHFLTRWGSELGDRRKLDLDRASLAALLRGDELATGSVPRGPVAIVWNGVVLGRGVVGARGLRHELGRPYAQRLQELIDGAHELES